MYSACENFIAKVRIKKWRKMIDRNLYYAV